MLRQYVALGLEFDHLPNDTEESLVATSLHRAAITALYTSLTLCGPHRGLPWFVGNQLMMAIPRQGGQGPYMPSPDILVHPTLTSGSRSSLILAADGPPALVIEVTSPATALERDLNLTSPQGKPQVYEAAGVREYLVFDPVGDIIPAQVWARRAGPGGFVPWAPEADGRYASAALGITFQPQGLLLRVYDQDGRLVPLTEKLAERDRQLAEQLAERDRRLAELEAELRRLRGA
jgi:Uma2 family endonuclease